MTGMIERAITQVVVSRSDGSRTTDVYSRPEHVLATVRRLHQWRDAPESCGNCRSGQATSVRAGMAVCERCWQQIEVRIGVSEPTRRSVAERVAWNSDTGLAGYAIVFHARSLDLGGFKEVILPEAAMRTLKDGSDDVFALAHHDAQMPVASWHRGTLDLIADSRGVFMRIPEPPRTSFVRDLVITVQDGLVSKQSFGFIALDDDYKMVDKEVIRYVMDMHIMETSMVLWPAYPQTTLTVGGVDKRTAAEERHAKLRLAV